MMEDYVKRIPKVTSDEEIERKIELSRRFFHAEMVYRILIYVDDYHFFFHLQVHARVFQTMDFFKIRSSSTNSRQFLEQIPKILHHQPGRIVNQHRCVDSPFFRSDVFCSQSCVYRPRGHEKYHRTIQR